VSDLDELRADYKLAKQLIAAATKEQVVWRIGGATRGRKRGPGPEASGCGVSELRRYGKATCDGGVPGWDTLCKVYGACKVRTKRPARRGPGNGVARHRG
jgi:hypothetical protein